MLIFVSCLVIFVYGMLSSLLGTIIPGLAGKLDLSNTQLGYLALAQGLGLAGMSVIAGALMDRRGKKIGVVGGLTVTLLGLLLLTYAPSLAATVAAMLLLGCGGSLVIVGANAIASDVSDAKRAVTLNFLNVFSGLGGLATPLVAGNLLSGDPHRIAIFGAEATLFVLCVAVVTPMNRPEVRARNQAEDAENIFASASLYPLCAVTFLYTACEFGIWNWLPKYLIAMGMAEKDALNILSLGFACGLLFGRIVATTILWRLSALAVTIFCSVGMMVATATILHPMQLWTTAAAVFLTGFVMAPVFPSTIAIVGKLFKQRSATAIGFAITCGFSGLMLSSPVIGWISGADPKGIGRGLMLLPVMAFLMVVILASSSRLCRMEEERALGVAEEVVQGSI